MSWKEQNAIKRIFNSYKRAKSFIYKEDIEALKTVSEALESYKQKTAIDNILFAKLLAVHLTQNLQYYKSMDLALKKVDDDLKHSLTYHLTILQTAFNQTQYNNYLESLGIVTDFLCTKEQSANNEKIMIQNAEAIQKNFLKSWTYEQIEKSFYNSTNDFIKNIENYK